MNYVYWPPIAGAKSYTLFIHEGDVCIGTEKFDHTDPLYYVDTEIKEKVQYSYLVEIEYENSINNKTMSDKVSVTAIVPNSYVNALELVDYELPNGNKKFVVNSENINIAKHNKDKISVSFPSKAYLNYDLTLTIDNEYEILNEFYSLENLKDNAKNDTTLYANFLVSQAGTYKAKIIAKAENDHFGESDVITSEKSVTISKLKGSSEGITYASYKGANKIRIIFDEFVLENGNSAPKSYYKLYRSEKGSKSYTRVEGEIDLTGEVSEKLYVDDYIYDNTKIYEYTLVITDGTLYSENSSKITVYPYSIDSQTRTQIYGEQILDYIEWEVRLPSDNVNIAEAYIFEKPISDTSVVIPDDFYINGEPVGLTGESETLYKCRTYGNTIGNKVYMLVVTQEENKVLGEWISDGVTRNRDKRIANFYNEYGSLIETKPVVENQNYSSWNEIQLPSIPSKVGYKAIGWRTFDSPLYSEYDNVSLVSSTTNFYAEYKEIRTAEFYDENGNYIKDIVDEDPYEGNYEVQLPSIAEKDGYIGYWRNSYDGSLYSPYSYVYLYSSRTLFTAEYVREANFYDEYGSFIETIVNSSWQQMQLPSIAEKDGYIGYWRNSYDSSLYSPNSYVYLYSSTTSFTAEYVREANFYDEYGSLIETKTVVEDPYNSYWNRIELPSIPEKDGYIVNGWRNNDDNSLYSSNSYVYLYSSTTSFTAEYVIEAYTSEDYTVYLVDTNEQTYSLYCEQGYTYSVSWVDSYQGGTELDLLMKQQGITGNQVDVYVSIYSPDGSAISTSIDSGYNTPYSFNADVSGDYKIVVQPDSSGNTGYFAIKFEQIQ